MADNLEELPPEELIKIISTTRAEQNQVHQENIQLKSELAALNGKLTLLLEQNATLNDRITKFIAATKPSTSQQSNKSQSVNNEKNKRINEFFSVVPSKRIKSNLTASNITSIEQQAINSVPNVSSDSAANVDEGHEQMDISASNSIEETTPNAAEWQFVDYKGKKNAQNHKIPPIQIDVTIDGRASLFALLQRSIGTNKYTINQLKTKNSVRVHPANEIVAASLVEVLLSHEYKFHSYLGNDKKKQCYVVRGLNGIDAPDEVKKHLIRAGLPDNITVLRHTTGYQRANPNKSHNMLYKVIIGAGVKIETLRNIQSIFGLAIKWEKLKSNGVTQCHHCQSYFHTAACCNHEFRCVKCPENHPPGECSKTNDASAVPHCVNCKGAHTANNHKECQYFQQKIKPIIERRMANKDKDAGNGSNNNTSNNGSIKTTKNTSFASLFGKNGSNVPNNITNQTNATTSKSSVSDSAPLDQQKMMDFFMKTYEIMSKSIANQEKILSLLTDSNKNGQSNK